MHIFFAIFPFLAIPAIYIFLQQDNPVQNIFYVSLMIVLAMSFETLKATFYAPKGHLLWLDFVSSLALLIGIILYIVNYDISNIKDSIWLLLIASISEVVVGFIISISNARRDFNTN